jgi:hypothetical protein
VTDGRQRPVRDIPTEPEEPVREIPPEPEGSGARDATAPVVGSKLREPSETDVLKLIDQLSDREKAKFIKRWQEDQPGHVEAAHRTRRERMRATFTALVILAVVAQAFVAIYVSVIDKDVSWNTAKDWLAYSVVPLTGLVAAAAVYWFPSRSDDLDRVVASESPRFQ